MKASILLPSFDESLLQGLGLSANEITLYVTLLKMPEATMPLLVKESGLARTLIYYLLEHLFTFGLVRSFKRGKKTIYQAESPERLHDVVRKMSEDVERKKNAIGELVTNLSGVYRLAQHKPGIQFFEGIKGFKEALYDTLTAKETIYAYSDEDAILAHAREINDEYVARRLRAKKAKKLLVLDTPATRAYCGQQKKNPLTEARFLPKNMVPFRTGLEIYDQKILYMTIRPENIMSVLIHDPDIYALQRSLFEAIWNFSEPFPTLP